MGYWRELQVARVGFPHPTWTYQNQLETLNLLDESHEAANVPDAGENQSNGFEPGEGQQPLAESIYK
jgi:hypothetical protein